MENTKLSAGQTPNFCTMVYVFSVTGFKSIFLKELCVQFQSWLQIVSGAPKEQAEKYHTDPRNPKHGLKKGDNRNGGSQPANQKHRPHLHHPIITCVIVILTFYRLRVGLLPSWHLGVAFCSPQVSRGRCPAELEACHHHHHHHPPPLRNVIILKSPFIVVFQ